MYIIIEMLFTIYLSIDFLPTGYVYHYIHFSGLSMLIEGNKKMTDEQKLRAFDDLMAKKALQKKKDRFYWEKIKHDTNELKRVVSENGLDSELVPFSKTVEDYID